MRSVRAEEPPGARFGIAASGQLGVNDGGPDGGAGFLSGVSVLLRMLPFEVGPIVDLGSGSSYSYAAPSIAFGLGTGELVDARVHALVNLGLHSYDWGGGSGLSPGLSSDPGARATLPYLGVRAGFEIPFNEHSRAHFLFGMWAFVERDFAPRDVTYSFTSQSLLGGPPQQQTNTRRVGGWVGGAAVRLGYSFDFH